MAGRSYRNECQLKVGPQGVVTPCSHELHEQPTRARTWLVGASFAIMHAGGRLCNADATVAVASVRCGVLQRGFLVFLHSTSQLSKTCRASEEEVEGLPETDCQISTNVGNISCGFW